jgi:hypothetical protein
MRESNGAGGAHLRLGSPEVWGLVCPAMPRSKVEKYEKQPRERMKHWKEEAAGEEENSRKEGGWILQGS